MIGGMAVERPKFQETTMEEHILLIGGIRELPKGDVNRAEC